MQKVMPRFAMAVFWLLVLVSAAPAADSFFCKDLGITFPEQLGGLPLSGATNFERDEPGLGIGISYRKGLIKADIYIYSAGLRVVPNGVKSKLMNEHFYAVSGDVVEMERRGVYQNVQVLVPEEEVLLGGQKFLHANLRFTHEGIPMDSHVYLTGLAGRFFKIRLSFPEAEAKAAREIQRAFLGQLGQLLDSVPPGLKPSA